MSKTDKKQSVYIPQTGYVYPKHQDEHMITVDKVYNNVTDQNYAYVDKSFWFSVKKFFLSIGTFLVAFPIASMRYGFKVNGRKNLKKSRKLLKNGCVSVSNHVFMWDYILLESVIWPKHPYHVSWRKNLDGKNRNLIRLSGGIPFPTHDGYSAHAAFSNSLNEVLKNKQWLHIFPEASEWHYYAPIRQFKKGAFTLAYNHKVPIVPFAFSFRKRGFLGRLLKIKSPCVTLNIGKPLFMDFEKPKGQAVREMMTTCRNELIKLAGLENEEKNQETMKNYTYQEGVPTPLPTNPNKEGNY